MDMYDSSELCTPVSRRTRSNINPGTLETCDQKGLKSTRPHWDSKSKGNQGKKKEKTCVAKGRGKKAKDTTPDEVGISGEDCSDKSTLSKPSGHNTKDGDRGNSVLIPMTMEKGGVDHVGGFSPNANANSNPNTMNLGSNCTPARGESYNMQSNYMMNMDQALTQNHMGQTPRSNESPGYPENLTVAQQQQMQLEQQ